MKVLDALPSLLAVALTASHKLAHYLSHHPSYAPAELNGIFEGTYPEPKPTLPSIDEDEIDDGSNGENNGNDGGIVLSLHKALTLLSETGILVPTTKLTVSVHK